MSIILEAKREECILSQELLHTRNNPLVYFATVFSRLLYGGYAHKVPHLDQFVDSEHMLDCMVHANTLVHQFAYQSN